MSSQPRRRVDRFAQIPWRVTEALTRNELSRDEYVTLAYVIAKISRDLYERPVDEQVLVTTLAVIGGETNWTKSPKQLSNVIDSITEKGWVGSRTTAGSKWWEIWLTGALVRESDEKVVENERQDFQLSWKSTGDAEAREAFSDAETSTEKAGNAAAPYTETYTKTETEDQEPCYCSPLSVPENGDAAADDRDALALEDLITALGDDADENTYPAFAAEFLPTQLRASHYRYVTELIERGSTSKGQPIHSPAGFARDALRTILTGSDGSAPSLRAEHQHPEYQSYASYLLRLFNERAGTKFTGQRWRVQIIDRLVEFPDVSGDEHRAIIETALDADWIETVRPSLVWGGAVFETHLHRVRP